MEEIPLNDKGWPTKEWVQSAYLDRQMTTTQIAEITGRGVGRISMLLKEYDIPARKAPVIDREWLVQKYEVERLSFKEIAQAANVTLNQIRNAINLLDIPARRPINRTVVPTKEWLIENYVSGKMTSKQVREATGYSKTGLSLLLKNYDIERKGRSIPPLDISRDKLYQMHVMEGLTAVKIAARLSCENTTISKLLKTYGITSEKPLVNQPIASPFSDDELRDMYCQQKLAVKDIAKLAGVSSSTVTKWLKRCDISLRKSASRPKPRTASANNRMGKDFNAYEREEIFRRDAYQCKMPQCGSSDQLEAHHILAIKHGGTNSLDNGITLCHTCHLRIMHKEQQYVQLFLAILNHDIN